MSRTRQVALNAPSSSQVQLTPQASRDSSAVRISGTLRLRAAENDAVRTNNDQDRRIRWSEDVIDNEGMGKKSSKVCCIYHKARPVGESSSEEDSDSSSSDSDSDSEIDCHRHRSRPHAHDKAGDNPNQDPSQQSLDRGRASCCSNHHGKKGKQRKPSPNAYEKMPKNKSHQKIQKR